MPARQVREILDMIGGVHEQLANRYRELDARTSDERIKLLLEDMEKREERFQECVAEFEAEGHREVLNTWIQFVPDEVVHVENVVDRLALPNTLSDLVEETVRLNSSLVNAYVAVGQSADLPQVRELFQNLAQLEENNDVHYAKVLLDD